MTISVPTGDCNTPPCSPDVVQALDHFMVNLSPVVMLTDQSLLRTKKKCFVKVKVNGLGIEEET